MAAPLLRQILGQHSLSSEVQVVSAGTHALTGLSASPEAIQVLAEGWQLDLTEHAATLIDKEEVQSADLILTMGRSHRDYLLGNFPEAAGKTFVLAEFSGGMGDVSDPIGSGIQEYRRVAQEIETYLRRSIPKITEFLGLKEGL